MAKDEIGQRRPAWSSVKAKPSLAVALDYKGPDGRPNPRRAPRVAATGRGAVADQIVAIAFEKGVPVREDADLAQILSTVDVDAEIPIDALAAVAEILSYLYRFNRAAMDAMDVGPAGRMTAPMTTNPASTSPASTNPAPTNPTTADPAKGESR
jgi:flagellar biosynthesis protein